MKMKTTATICLLAGLLIAAGLWFIHATRPPSEPTSPPVMPPPRSTPAPARTPARTPSRTPAHPTPTPAPAAPQVAGFHVANWNVENLFDTVADPRNRRDDEFLPANPDMRWTRDRLETKLDNLAQVITGMNNGNGPDILGLEEVENEAVIRRLMKKLTNKSYALVHEDSPDPRGIDTALLFNHDLFSLLEFRTYEVPLKWHRSTRDILHAKLKDLWGRKIHVLVNHWPSRGLGVEESDMDRFAAARTLSQAVSSIFKKEPSALVIILGDFNDEPSSRSIRDILDVEPYPSRSAYKTTRLYNLTAQKAAQGFGTYLHTFDGEREWRMYDQIIVSGSILQSAQIEYDQDSLWIIRPDYMLKATGRQRGAPIPTYEGRDYYRGGYSDHLPIGVRFTYSAP